jgi:hypothetical protein
MSVLLGGGQLSEPVVKIHRQLRRNLPTGPELHEIIRKFLSTGDLMPAQINVDGLHTPPANRGTILSEIYTKLRECFNRCEFIRSNISSFGLQELKQREDEFRVLLSGLDPDEPMSPLRSVIEHIKEILHQRRSTPRPRSQLSTENLS